jgi:hypothetical protein
VGALAADVAATIEPVQLFDINVTQLRGGFSRTARLLNFSLEDSSKVCLLALPQCSSSRTSSSCTPLLLSLLHVKLGCLLGL